MNLQTNMAIQITKEEYKKKFGVEPDFSKAKMVSTQSLTPPLKPPVSPEAAAESRTDVKNAAKAGFDEIKQSFAMGKDANNSRNMLEFTGKGIEAGATFVEGAVNTIFSPLAPLFKPVGKAVDYLGQKSADATEALSSPEQAQEFALSPAGERMSRVFEDTRKLSTTAGVSAGFIKPPKPTASLGAKPTMPPEPPPGGSGGSFSGVKNKVGTMTSELRNNPMSLLEKPTPKPVQSALKDTKTSVFDEYSSAAKKATESYKNPTPLEMAGEKAQSALDTIQRKLNSTAQQKNTVINQAAVGNKPVGSIVVKFRQNLSNYLKSKTAIEGDSSLLRNVMSEAEKLGNNPSAKQVDKFIDYVQDKIYTSKKDLTVPVTDSTTAALRQLTGILNENLKSQLPESYRGLNSRYSTLVEVRNELNSKLGAGGERGGSLMKRVFSPSDANTKKLFEDVRVYTGVDLVNEATIARYVMETMGDARQASLLEQLQLPSLSKQGILDYVKNYIIEQANTPEAQIDRARSFTKPDTSAPAPAKPINMQSGMIKNPFYVKGTDGKLLGSIPRGKVGTVAVQKIKPSGELHVALEDVNVGEKSMSNLPILVKKNSDGTYIILDGNHRMAAALRNGDKDIQIMTDEKLYRQLAAKEAGETSFLPGGK